MQVLFQPYLYSAKIVDDWFYQLPVYILVHHGGSTENKAEEVPCLEKTQIFYPFSFSGKGSLQKKSVTYFTWGVDQADIIPRKKTERIMALSPLFRINSLVSGAKRRQS